MATITENKKTFMFEGKELVTIPGLTPEEIQNHYSSQYPELINAQIDFLGPKENGDLLYEFKLKTGTKG